MEVVVVVGVGGMGLACARRLGSGRHVLVADSSTQRLQEVADLLRGEGHSVSTQAVDVADRGSMRALAQGAAVLGPIGVIVYTAGVSPTMAAPNQIYRIDLLGPAYAVDEFFEVAGPGTCMICIASLGAYRVALDGEIERQLAITPADELPALIETLPGQDDPRTAYHVAKRANQLRVEATARRWGSRGARLNSLSPGIIATPMSKQELAGPNGDGIQNLVTGSALGRLGTPDDIANAVAFLAGPEASFVTGTDLLVDGGALPQLRWG